MSDLKRVTDCLPEIFSDLEDHVELIGAAADAEDLLEFTDQMIVMLKCMNKKMKVLALATANEIALMKMNREMRN